VELSNALAFGIRKLDHQMPGAIGVILRHEEFSMKVMAVRRKPVVGLHSNVPLAVVLEVAARCFTDTARVALEQQWVTRNSPVAPMMPRRDTIEEDSDARSEQ
jgi:hypothetical protein